MIFLIWGSKPMSSIRSASSSTKYEHLFMLVVPLSRKSRRRPGVATAISTPRSRSRACGPLEAPPKRQVIFRPKAWQKSIETSCTCWANSRVGNRTRTDGPSPRWRCGCLVIWTRAGSIKARVFPDPVLAIEMMSRPLMAIGHEIDWMTVGFWNFPYRSSWSCPGSGASLNSNTGRGIPRPSRVTWLAETHWSISYWSRRETAAFSW